MNIKTQIQEKTWKDETGADIPANRITKSEKLRERLIYKAAKDASSISKQLVEFKGKVVSHVQQIIDAVVLENEGKAITKKGSITLYNFDGSIKIETNVSERIDFDDILLQQCKAKLDEMLNDNLTSIDDFIKEIIMSAFETSKGKPDHRRLLGLKKYLARVKNPLFHEAMELLDKSIRRPDSRAYYRVWVRDENGKYQNIDLNFSSVEA